MNGLSKRVVSLAMATAMVLSAAAVPTTDANAASKYSLTKRTAAYTGKTYSYSLKGVSKSQYAKVSVSGTAKNLVKVKLGSKTIKSSTKINGTGKTLKLKVTASKASGKKYALTAKIYNKKNNKLAKTLKGSTVTVYNHSIKSISGTTTLEAGATTTLKAVKKYAESKGTVKWTSSNTDVATVSSSGVVTGVGAGTSVITATCGAYSQSVVVTVTAADTATGVTGSVVNSLSDYPNTVFVNQNAKLVITVKDGEGKVVPNAPVTLDLKHDDDSAIHPHGVLNNGYSGTSFTATTDALGQATFVIGANATTKVDIDDTSYVGSVSYTATVVGNLNATKSYSGTVGFAAIELGRPTVVATRDGKTITDLKKGENAVSTNSIQNTVAVADDETGRKSPYIATQQVSAAGTTNHQVTFEVVPKVVIPGTSTTNDNVLNFYQPVKKTCEKYSVYDTVEEKIPLEVESSKLRYATLNFNSLQLSKYTTMTIESFSNVDCKADHSVGTPKTIKGEYVQSNYGYQIPVTEGNVKAIKVTITSKGQVNTDRNAGYNIESITGIYNEKGSTSTQQSKPLPSAKIKWEAINAVYSNEMSLTDADLTALGITKAATDNKFTYQVPVFPYTGNAIIKEFDKNGKIVTYYAAPVENKWKSGTTYANENVISALQNKVNDDGNKAYKVTETEANTALTTGVTQNENGTQVYVNSEKVGTTAVKGTLTVDGVAADVLNAASSTLYTSVQWNPIPNTTVSTRNANGYIALAGQSVTLYAQLVDKNGNPVTEKDVDVRFEYPTLTNITKVSDTGKTDTNGQAKLVLNAAKKAELIGVKAKAAQGAKFDVVLYVGKTEGEAVEEADLYWVDANLSFTGSACPYTDEPGVENPTTTNNDSKTVDVSSPIVGANMKYGVQTVGNILQDGIFAGRTVTIDGLKVNMKASAGAKGTYTFPADENGVALASSTVAQKDYIISEINANSVGNEVTFTAKKTGSDDITTASVGVGAANINASIKLGVNWKQDGTAFKLVTPAGNNAVSTNTVYVQVTDTKGNVLKDQKVKLETTNMNALEDTEVESDGTKYVQTNSQGVAKFTVKQLNSVPATVVTAKMDGVDAIATTTINWVDEIQPLALVNAAASADKKQVVLTFNNDICAASVKAGEFSLEYTSSGKIYKLDVVNATANENTVTLDLAGTLATSDYTVRISKTSDAGMDYELADVTGETIDPNKSSVTFSSDKVAKFDITVVNSTSVKIENIEQPYTVDGGAVIDGYVVVVHGKNATVKSFKVNDDAKFTTISDLTIQSGDIVYVYMNGGSAGYTA